MTTPKRVRKKPAPRNPTPDELIAVLPRGGRGRTSIAKAANTLRDDYGYKHMTPQLFRLLVARLDDSDVTVEVSRAKLLLEKRNAQTSNLDLRRDNRVLVEALGTKENLLDAIQQIVEVLPLREPIKPLEYLGDETGKPMTVEILLSDLQIGKLQPGYNTPIARKRLYEMGRAACIGIQQKAALGYKVERIVLCLDGDIIESDKKHDNSARATDTSTAEQMYDATVAIFEFVVEPLARLGLPMEVVGIAGNHDWDGHGMGMYRPGRDMFAYPMYKSLEYISKRSGYDNVQFIIPDGSYAVVEFYGQYCLYEHGVGVSVTEASMRSHKTKRSEQEKKYITYFRMGDKHNVSTFNSGQYVVNGAFFGSGPGGEEYSSIMGYSSVAAQWMGYHVPRNDSRMTLYDSFTIQLGHIGD